MAKLPDTRWQWFEHFDSIFDVALLQEDLSGNQPLLQITEKQNIYFKNFVSKGFYLDINLNLEFVWTSRDTYVQTIAMPDIELIYAGLALVVSKRAQDVCR